jgi:hypothetical protein
LRKKRTAVVTQDIVYVVGVVCVGARACRATVGRWRRVDDHDAKDLALGQVRKDILQLVVASQSASGEIRRIKLSSDLI